MNRNSNTREKTKEMVPSFYLVSPKQTLRITHKMTLGSSQGDFILDDHNLSSLHCEFIPRLLNLSVKDLNSTNGVYVNKQKIFPHTEFKLEVGDKVMMGSMEFIVYDEDEMKRVKSQDHNKKYEEKGLYISPHIMSRFGVSMKWLSLYALAFFGALASFVMNLELESLVPKEIEFLSKLYSQLIYSDGIKVLFLVGCCSLAHAFFIKVILKSTFHRFLSGLIYAAIVLLVVDFRLGPVWYVKQYVINREIVLSDMPNMTAITKFKELMNAGKNVTGAYKKIEKKLSVDDKALFAKDYQMIKKEIAKREANI